MCVPLRSLSRSRIRFRLFSWQNNIPSITDWKLDCQCIQAIFHACFRQTTTTAARTCKGESQLPVASPSLMQETVTMTRISVVAIYIRRIVCIISVWWRGRRGEAAAVGVAALCHQSDYIAVRRETSSHMSEEKGGYDRNTRRRYIPVAVYRSQLSSRARAGYIWSFC